MTEQDKGRCAPAPRSAVPMRVQDGWTVDFEFLMEIAQAVEMENEGCSLEMVEAIIIELNKRGCLCIVSPPNAAGEPQPRKPRT